MTLPPIQERSHANSQPAVLAAILVACSDDSNQPAAPAQAADDPVSGAVATAEVTVAGEPGVTRGHYVDGFPNGGSTISIGTSFTEIQVYRGLPAGKYIATASAVLTANGTDVHFVDCIFTIGGTIRGELARGMVGGNIGDNNLSLPLTIGFTANQRTDLGVSCATDVEGIVFTQASPITAIRVDQLTTQHP
jgi:hypothetical protein